MAQEKTSIYSEERSPRRPRLGGALRRLTAGLLLVLVLAAIWWGYDNQTPADPFTERSWWQALLRPLPHPDHAAIPVKPVGALPSLIPRDLDLDPASIAPADNASGSQPFLVRRFAAEPGVPLMAAVGSDGRVLASRDAKQWTALSLPQGRVRKPASASILEGHHRDILSIAFSPDGTRIVTTSKDGTARIWVSQTSESAAVLENKGQTGPVLFGAFSPDGSRIVTFSEETAAHLWDAATGQKIGTIEGHTDVIRSVAFSPDGSRILTSSEEGTVRLWDVATREQIGPAMRHDDVQGARFSEDGSRILSWSGSVSGSVDRTIRRWDAATGQQIGPAITVTADASRVPSKSGDAPNPAAFAVPLGAQFSADGSRILSWFDDGTVRLWDAATGAQINPVIQVDGGVSGALFSADEEQILTWSEGRADLWNAATGAPIGKPMDSDGGVLGAEFDADGSRVLLFSNNGLWLWDGGSGRKIGPTTGVVSFSVSDDGARIAMGLEDGTVSLFNMTRDRPVATGAAVADDGSIWVVGPAGYVAWLRDGSGGQSYYVGEDVDLFAIDVTVWGRVFVAGAGGRIFSSELDSNNWIPEKTNASATIYALHIKDDDRGWAVGDAGQILFTRGPDKTGGAGSWETQVELKDALSLEGLRLTDIYVQSDGKLAWAINDGTFLTPPRAFESHDATKAQSWRLLEHFTAPWWYLFGLPAIVLVGFVNVRAWRPDPLPPVESIVGQGTPDRPLGLSDADALNLKEIVLGLSRFLRNVNTEPPLTIAISGRWGTGKSSLMNMLQEDLRFYGCRPVWFNAWHHRQEEHLLAALLENIRAQAIPPWWTLPGLAFRGRLFLLRTRNDLRGLLTLAFLLIVAYLVLKLATTDSQISAALTNVATVLRLEQVSIPVGGGVSIPLKDVGLLGASGLTLFSLFVWFRNRLVALSANPAKLLSKYAGRVKVRDFADQLSFRYRFGREFADVCTALRSGRSPGLVVLIDDLDRCRPQDVLDVLEAVNYFVSVGDCFVILGMDRRQVEHCVGVGFADIVKGLPDDELNLAAGDTRDDSGRQRAFARHYLEKLINLEVPVPSLTEPQAVDMLSGTRESNTATEPSEWVNRLSSAIRSSYEFVRFGTIGVVLGLLCVGVISVIADRTGSSRPIENGSAVEEPPSPSEPLSGSAPESAGQPAQSPAGDATGASAPVQTTIDTPTESSFEVPPIIEANESDLGEPWRWAWWGPTLLAVIIVVIWVAGIALRRRSQVVQDSPAFQRAMHLVMPLVYSVSNTPRAIKRFQNRMRYLAVRLIPLPPEVDPVERLVFRLGKLLGRDWVPESRFARGQSHALTEPKLILLGAAETFAPTLQTANADQFATWLNRDSELTQKRRSLSEVTNLHQWHRIRDEFRHDPLCRAHWPTEEDIMLYRGFVAAAGAVSDASQPGAPETGPTAAAE